ncbi:MAG TPA: FGGY family carbohydrate kinase [Patescibacteria group bacterium]|nr:FGGY family carbohydrate kinase [Patescibacteria group bacterium]
MLGLVLGIDAGTTGLKVAALNSKGTVVATSRVPYTAVTRDWHEGEQDPWMWCRAMQRGLGDLRSRLDLGDVVGVGVSGQTHGLVVVDESGEPLGRCLTWADTRCHAEVEELRSRFGDLILEHGGNPVVEAFTAPKMLWAARHWQDRVRGGRLCLPKDFLRWTLTGDWTTDPSDAASTLVFDLKSQAWSARLVSAVGWSADQLPPVHASASVVGRVSEEGAARTGLSVGTPVVTGASDVSCAALGAGLVEPGGTYVNIGTAAQVLTVAPPSRDGRLYTFGHCLPGRFLAMGSTYAAGLSLSWFASSFRSSGGSAERLAAALHRLDRLAYTVRPGSRGLFFLPYLAGISLPVPDPFGRGAFVGLTSSHGRAECWRAVLEGVGFAIRTVLEEIDRAVPTSGTLVLGGGGGSSRVWSAMLASIFGRPVSVLKSEASPLGAAMLAGIGVAMYRDAEEAARRCVRIRATYEPDPDAAGYYADGHPVFEELTNHLRPVFPKLARLAV